MSTYMGNAAPEHACTLSPPQARPMKALPVHKRQGRTGGCTMMSSYHDGNCAPWAQDSVRLGNDGPAGALRQLVHDQAAGDQVDAGAGQACLLRRCLEEPVEARPHTCHKTCHACGWCHRNKSAKLTCSTMHAQALHPMRHGCMRLRGGGNAVHLMGSCAPPAAACRRRCRCRVTARKWGDRSSAAMLAPGKALRSSSVDKPAQAPQSQSEFKGPAMHAESLIHEDTLHSWQEPMQTPRHGACNLRILSV
jgi:hypothetical protein